jgi:phosphate uptake regulator
MHRKLVKQGSTTLMISLPAKWIKENKLEKGSEVKINRINRNLILSPSNLNYRLETSIKIKGLSESLIRTYITNTYRRGFDWIKVVIENEEQYLILKNVIQTRLLGFEITKKEENYCIVESVTEPSLDLFENLLKKLLFNISELFGATLENAKGRKLLFEEIEEKIQRYDNFCRRAMFKGAKTSGEKELYWAFLTLIIHGNRELYYLNKEIKSKNYSKEIIVLIKKTKEIFDLIKKTYLDRKVDSFEEVHKLESSLRKSANKLILSGGEEAVLAGYLISAGRRFYQSGSPLFALILS